MFEGRRLNWGWPAIIGVAVLAFAVLQVVRVNRPRELTIRDDTPLYSQKGSLVSGALSIPGGEFYAARVNLNKRTKLIGEFRTPQIRERVAAAVINEADLEGWRSGADVKALTKIGYVPGGKINVVLEPGVYFLLIDNRSNDHSQFVQANFQLE